MNSAETEIRREKTAIFRARLSMPMQMLLKHRFLSGDYTVFDFGCGRGDDLRALETAGISVSGWDPHYFPKTPRTSADVVNLGFVINVIERPDERADALKSAFALAKKLLVVTVMLNSQANYQSVKQHADGIRTSTKTFQKYFSQAEIQDYVERVLGRQPVVVGPGCLFIFCSDQDEQDFLEQRHAHHISPDELMKWSLPADKNLRIYERNKDLLEHFWRRCLDLGRLPVADEYQRINELKETIGSPRSALAILSAEDREKALKRATAVRVADLSVFFALNLFERRRSAAALSPKIQRDIKAFFGTYKNAIEVATPVLFSAGRTDELLSACKIAATAGLGYLEGQKSLTLATNMVDRLPPLLRVYIGCASQLYGEIDSADMVKIHIGSAKLTLTRYDDFGNKAIPLMLERIKIDMRAREVDYFEYGVEFPPSPLYFKGRYISKRSKLYKQQCEFDAAIAEVIPFSEFNEHGPSAVELDRMLKVRKLRLNGLSLAHM